jgi:hypothetical protein
MFHQPHIFPRPPGFWGLALCGGMTSRLLTAVLAHLRASARSIVANGWLCQQFLLALGFLGCRDDEFVAAISLALASDDDDDGTVKASRRPVGFTNWTAFDVAAAASALAALGHSDQHRLLHAMVDRFVAASRGGLAARVGPKMLRACAVLGMEDAARWRRLLEAVAAVGASRFGVNRLGELQQAVMYLQVGGVFRYLGWLWAVLSW